MDGADKERSVLIADDDDTIRLALQYLLEEQGYAVRLAGDGQEAIEAINAEAPDLVLLDIKMPKRSGYDVCQSIRSNPKCGKVQIVVMSALMRDTELEKAMALGADSFLAKPFVSADLLREVATRLEGSVASHA